MMALRNPDRIVDPQPHEPPEQQVAIHLLHQLALGPDRKQDLEQARPDQPFRRDRGAPEVGAKSLELRLEAGQRVVHHLPDIAQRMPQRDPHIQIDIAEQRPAHLVRSTHHRPRQSLRWMNHVLRVQARPDYCSGLLEDLKVLRRDISNSLQSFDSNLRGLALQEIRAVFEKHDNKIKGIAGERIPVVEYSKAS